MAPVFEGGVPDRRPHLDLPVTVCGVVTAGCTLSMQSIVISDARGQGGLRIGDHGRLAT